MSTKIHPSAVIAKSVELGPDVVIGPNCVVDDGAVIGNKTVVDANVVIGKNVRVGERNQLYANCVIGRPPQLLGLDPEKKIGLLEIGDDNILRENVTIHPSMHHDKSTQIGNENLLMVGVHLGHDGQYESEATHTAVRFERQCIICHSRRAPQTFAET